MPSLVVVGYSGAAALLLAAVCYTISIILAPGAGGDALGYVLVLVNLGAWVLGARLQAREGSGKGAGSLVALGDALFPLNLCAAWYLFGFASPGSTGGPLLAAVIAGAYLLLAGLRVRSLSALDPGYPWFLAASGAMLIQVTAYSLHFSAVDRAWLLIALGVILGEGLARIGAESAQGIRGAAAGLLLAGSLAIGLAFMGDPLVALLEPLGVISPILVYWAIASRTHGETCRLFGFAAYVSFTISITASLWILHASLSILVLATLCWFLVLIVFGITFRNELLEPFRESAHWFAFVLAGSLMAFSMASWWPLPGLGTWRPSNSWFAEGSIWLENATRLATGVALLGMGGGLGVLGAWRRRFPSIAYSVGGLLANVALLNACFVVGPLFVFVGALRLLQLAGGTLRAAAVLAVVLGAAYCAAATELRRVYAFWALQAVGYVALALAIVMARGDRPFTAGVTVVVALVLLWRSLAESSLVPHAGFLVAMLVAPFVGARDRADEALALGLVSLAVFAVYRAVGAREGPTRRTAVTIGGALVFGILCLAWTSQAGASCWWVPLLLWIGIPALLVGERDRAGRDTYDSVVFVGEWLETGGFLLSHVAGAMGVLLLWRFEGFSLGNAALILAPWAWAHLVLRAELRRSGPERPATLATDYVLWVFALALCILPIFSTGRDTLVGALLLDAALAVSLAYAASTPVATRRLHLFAEVASVLAIALSLGGGGKLTCVALFVVALLLLRRSIRERLLWCQLTFMGLGTWCALVVAERTGWNLLPVALACIGILAVGRVIEATDGRNARVRASLVWAILAGLCVLVVGGWSPALDNGTTALLWVGFIGGFVAWGERSPREMEGRAEQPEDSWIGTEGTWLGHAAGALLLVSVVRAYGFGSDAAALALALWAWAHFLAAKTMESGSVAARATGHAIHVFAILALALAYASRGSGMLGAWACLALMALYVTLRLVAGGTLLEHMAAVAGIEGVWLVGIAWGVPWREFYLLPIAAYLYIRLHLDRSQAIVPSKRASALDVYGLRPTRRRLWSVCVVVLAVLYPLWALGRSVEHVHLLFLGGATVVLLYGFLLDREDLGLVRVACVAFVGGAVYLLSRGGGNPVVTGFLAAAGLLVVMSLILASSLIARGVPEDHERA